MIEYLVIFAIVGIAGFFVGRHLWREARTGQCANCDCASKSDLLSIKDTDRFSV